MTSRLNICFKRWAANTKLYWLFIERCVIRFLDTKTKNEKQENKFYTDTHIRSNTGKQSRY